MSQDLYKEFPIYGFTIATMVEGHRWRARGLVFDPDKTRTVEIQRIQGPLELQFLTAEKGSKTLDR